MILGIYGLQDSGKTTLVERFISELARKGYRAATVKHSSHEGTFDSRGKDSWRHWKAGGDPVVFSSIKETALFKRPALPVQDVAKLLEAEFHPDIVIVEGLKEGPFPKVALGNLKPRKGTVLVNPSLRRLVNYAEAEIGVERIKRELPQLDCLKCGHDCEGLAREIWKGRKTLGACRELSEGRVEVRVGGANIPLGAFASEAVEGTVRGILGTLKGYTPGSTVDVRIAGSKRASRKALEEAAERMRHP